MTDLLVSADWRHDPGESDGQPWRAHHRDVEIIHDPATDCPACGYPSYCPCASCFRHIPAGMFPYYYDDDRMAWQCGNCGYTESIDDRTERQMEMLGELTL